MLKWILQKIHCQSGLGLVYNPRGCLSFDGENVTPEDVEFSNGNPSITSVLSHEQTGGDRTRSDYAE